MLRPRPNFKLARRAFSASATAYSRVFVAPPDPISHIRPVIYDHISSQKAQPVAYHQYSLQEFDVEPSGRLVSPEEQLWKLQRQQLDDFEQHFWLDVRQHSSPSLYFMAADKHAFRICKTSQSR